MKLQDSLLRLKKFQVEEKRRRVAQIDSMVAEFSKIARELEQEIDLEEQRAGIFDTTHFAYPTYARAARARRDNLNRSAQELMTQLDDARVRLEEAVAELEKAEGFDVRDRAVVVVAELIATPEEKSLGLRAAHG